jgi:8-oxo-dGTP pyrophosphatase MutT (NUDIX family)
MSGAGIVVYRIVNKNPEFLGLIALKHDQQRCRGIYDIPKGMVESKEEVKDAALRECFEESGLNPVLKSGPFTSGRITVWLGEVDSNDCNVYIYKNPETDIIEHLGYKWKSPEYIRKNCLNYLRPHLVWAENEVLNHI